MQSLALARLLVAQRLDLRGERSRVARRGCEVPLRAVGARRVAGRHVDQRLHARPVGLDLLREPRRDRALHGRARRRRRGRPTVRLSSPDTVEASLR